MTFRERLLATLRVIAPLFEEPGVMVVGSEVPNLLEPGVAATLVVSQDIDVGVPVERHAGVKRRLPALVGLHQSSEEPSVWIPESPELLEVNFIGLDASTRDSSDTYVFEDPDLPLLVFGLLSLLRPGATIQVEGVSVPIPRVAGLLLEKLLTERSGEKGDRDLLVALGLLLVASESDMDDLESVYRAVAPEMRRRARQPGDARPSRRASQDARPEAPPGARGGGPPPTGARPAVSGGALARLHSRARQVRANALVRRWEYRQRHHARGVWFRLRRLLAEAKSAWRLSEPDALRLIAEGYPPEPVGEQLEPRTVILFVPEERLEKAESRAQIGLRLSAELLHSRFLALVRWPEPDQHLRR